MNWTSRHSTFSLGSDSSSIYSDDDLISETKSTGAQSHHRTHLQPTIGGLPRENGQNFEATSTMSFSKNDASPDKLVEHNLSPDASSSSSARYRFETPEEAEERRYYSVAQARQVRHEIWDKINLQASQAYMQRVLAEHNDPNAKNVRLGPRSSHIDDYTANYEFDDSTGHQLVPRRRYSRATNLESISMNDAWMPTISAPPPSTMDAGQIAGVYSHEISSLQNILSSSSSVTEPPMEVTGPVTPRPRAISVSRDPSELALDDTDSSGLQCQSQRDATLQALSGNAEEIKESEDPADSGHGISQVQSEALNVTRRQGRVDWREGLTDSPPPRARFQASLYSSSGNEYGLGDHTRGFNSAEYVTKIAGSRSEEEARKRNVLKRIFCLPG